MLALSKYLWEERFSTVWHRLLKFNVLALCLRENTPSDIHFGLCYTSCLCVFGVERVGVVSMRKYAKRYTFWTLLHFMSTGFWRWTCWCCVYEKICQAIYILDFATLHIYELVGVVELLSNISVLYVLALYLPIIRKHTPPFHQDAPCFVLFYFQVRKRPKIPSFACHVANYNNASCN